MKRILAACVAIGLILATGCAHQTPGGSTAAQALKLAQRSNDFNDLNNLMSLHSWYHAAMMNDVELDKIWSKRSDICWAQNSGYWIGPESITKYYGRHEDRKNVVGQFAWHTITSPVVEVAEDRQTAKGVWYTAGIVGGFKNDKGTFMWMFEKYGVDFVFEDGKWKVWHMHVYTDTSWPLGGSIAGGRGETVGSESASSAAGKGKMMAPAAGSAMSIGIKQPPDIAEKNYIEVSPTTEVMLVPRPPEPYKTWNDTWSYTDPNEYQMFKGIYKEYKK